MDSMIGKVIGNYKILEVVGKGGMGTVFKGLDLALERRVALKMIDPILASDETFLRRFKTEAKALARLENPHIVTVYALQESEFGLFIVMEFVDGITVADMLLEGGPVLSEKAIPIFEQILSAIEHAHKNGVIHRDIKPRNIMITKQGKVKVTDFGLAKVRKPHGEETTITRATMGTPFYMSPEQVKGTAVDFRTDIYALGMTFYEMLAGRTPFNKTDSEFTIMKAIIETEFPPPSHFNPDMTKALSQVIMKAIEKEPARRYQSVDELESAITRLKTKTETKVAKPPRPMVEKPKRMSMGIMASLFGVIFVLLLIIFIPRLFRKDVEQPEIDKSKVQTETIADTGAQSQYQIPATKVKEESSEVIPSEVTGVHVSTDPSGANVYLNSLFKGTTPLDVDDIEEGRYKLRISLDGYQEVARTIDVQRGQSTEISERLIGLGTLSISCRPADVSIWIDGRRYSTAVIKNLTVGQHEVIIRKDGYADRRELVVIAHNEETKLDMVLQPQLGEVNILVKPYGSVYINDVLRQKDDDKQFSTTIQAGMYRIKVSHPSLGFWEKEIRVRPDAPFSKVIDFTKKGKVTIAASPGWGFVHVDNNNTGKETPAGLELTIGVHIIEVRRTVEANQTKINLMSDKQKLLIEEGDNGIIKFELKQEK